MTFKSPEHVFWYQEIQLFSTVRPNFGGLDVPSATPITNDLRVAPNFDELPPAGHHREGRGRRRPLRDGAPLLRGARMRQTLQGSFSAVSKANFASKYAFESSRRDLHNALLCTVL